MSFAAAGRLETAPRPERKPTVHELSDEQLMDRIASRDAQAFDCLLGRHLDPVHGYLRRLTGSAADAEDLAQETFLRIWQKAGSYRPGKVRVSTWLHRIAHNLAIDAFRRRQIGAVVRADLEDEAAGPSPFDSRAQAERGAELLRALNALPEAQRSAVLLCHVQGFSNREAAEIMAVSLHALESLVARGRRALKRNVLRDEA